MKHCVLFLTMLLFTFSSFAQKIVNRVDHELYSTVTTGYRVDKQFIGNSTAVALSMLTDKTSDEKVFQLFLYFETNGETFCQKNSKVIFKTFKGSIITLLQNLETGVVLSRRERVSSGEVVTSSLRTNYYITEEDLQILMTEGIQLMRFETLQGLLDYEYKTDALGKYIKSEYDLIFEKQDFGSDF